MSSRPPNQSPRVKVASLKVLEDEKSQRKLKKKASSRALLNQSNPGRRGPGDGLDQGSMVSVRSAASVKLPNNSPRGAVGNGKGQSNDNANGGNKNQVIKVLPEESNMTQLLKAMNGQDVLQLQVQLAKAMDDTSLLRSRLRSELENRQVLESKVMDLTEKLSDAKRGLTDTKSALNKVQAVASQLISKRDEREVQLQTALDQNGIYERKIAELEMHISHLSQINASATQASSFVAEKILNENLERCKQLDEELNQVRSQLAHAKRDNMRLTDEKSDLEYMLEAKKKRIALLEEHAKASEVQIPAEMLASTRDSFLMQMLDLSRNNTASGTNPNTTNLLRQSFSPNPQMMDAVNMNVMESKLTSLEGDKKVLEDRLLSLERQLLEQQKASLAQQQKLFETQQAQQAALVQQQQQQQQARPTSSQQQQGNRSAAQQIMNDADAQQLVREILTSRDGGARRSRAQPQAPPGQSAAPSASNASSSGDGNDNVDAPNGSPGSRNPSRGANTRASRVSNAQQVTRQSTSSIEREKEAMTSLPVTTQTVTFAAPEPSNNDVMRAIESTVRQYDSGALDNRTFEANTVGSMPSFDGADDLSVGSPSVGRMSFKSPRQDDENSDIYRRRLIEEKKVLKKEILEWSKSFEQKYNREPSRTEREMHAGSLYKRYRQKSKLLKELDGDTSASVGSMRMSYNASQQSINTIQEDMEI